MNIEQLYKFTIHDPRALELIFSGYLDGIWYSEDGDKFWMNPKFISILGYDAQTEAQKVDLALHLGESDRSRLSQIVLGQQETHQELELKDCVGRVHLYTFESRRLEKGMIFLFREQYELNHPESSIWIWEVEKQRVRWAGNLAHLPVQEPQNRPKTFDQWLELLAESEKKQALELLNQVRYGNLQTGIINHSTPIRQQLRHFSLQVKALHRNLQGEASVLVGYYQDITSAKLKEHKHNLSEQFYNLLFSTMNEGLLLIDKNLKILAWNKSAERITGLSYEQFQNFHFASYQDRILDTRLKPILFRDLPHVSVFKNQKTIQDQVIGFRLNSQNIFWYSVTAQPVLSPLDSELYAVLITFHDITQAHLSEMKLSKTKELLERSNTAARIGTWEVDLETNAVVWSRITREIHEVEPDFVSTVENGIQFYKEGYHRETITRAVENAIQTGESFDIELQIVTAKGNTIWVRAVGLVEFEDGKCTRLYGTLQDINRRKLLEESLIKQNEELAAAEEELRTQLEELMLTKKDLEESQAAMVAISDSFSQALVLIKANLVVIYANQMAHQILFKSQDSVLGLSLLDFLPLDLKSEVPYWAAKAAEGERMELEKQINIGDKFYWYEVKFRPAHKKNGEVLGVVFTLNDITERKLADLEFKNLSSEYERVFNGTQDALFLVRMVSGKFHYLRNNPTHQRLTGIKLETLRGKSPVELLGEELGNQLEANYFRCWNLSRAITYEEELDLPGGKRIWRTTLTPVKNNHLNGYIVGSSLDITLEKLAEKQKLELSARIEKIAEHFPGFLYEYILSPDGSAYFQYVSTGTKFLGYTKEELEADASNFFKDVWPEDMSALMESVEKSVQELSSWQHEWRKVEPDGSLRWLMSNASPERLENGNIGWYGFVSDITERKSAEENILKLLKLTKGQNQRLSEYAYITSHNIRSYVANLLGINNLLQENPGQADLLDILNQTAHQLDDTIHAMNELLTIENESDLKPQQGVNLRQAFLNNIGLLKNLIESAAEIEINIPEDISVRVIPAYLDSIINNLLTNAIKYRKNFQKSHITISAETNQDEVVFKVSDDGIGIDLNKYRNRLFKMRSRFHHGSEGKGLGLFFTKRQIEAMQGSISVESEPDIGSTFTIRLKKS